MNFFRHVALIASLLLATSAWAVPTTPTAAPDYEAGKMLYLNPAVSKNPKCQFKAGDFEKSVKELLQKNNSSVTPIVVFEQLGTTNANEALGAFRKQTLPDSNVIVFVACGADGKPSAAAYGGALFQQYVTKEEWQGIIKLAAPKLNTAADQFALTVLEGAIDQIDTGALAEAAKAKDEAAAAKAKAEAEALLAKQEAEQKERAAKQLAEIEDARTSHVVRNVLLVLLFGGAVGGFVFWRRRSATKA